MALRKQVADLQEDVRKLRALLENHPTISDLKKVHDEVRATRSAVADAAAAHQASLGEVTQSLNGVLAKAAELAGTTAPAPKKAAARAADPSATGKENT